eukprot:TRINITY_DN6842_c0_g1_i1.p1 TRINITY_DN6842_c0_g1~~TRINITY_DN6842_c0_g1_i1.p1  ORF type:complete len:383 (-),score=102.73 TRINITY_DN6842_c0_g1_i1:90-1076(-)
MEQERVRRALQSQIRQHEQQHYEGKVQVASEGEAARREHEAWLEEQQKNLQQRRSYQDYLNHILARQKEIHVQQQEKEKKQDQQVEQEMLSRLDRFVQREKQAEAQRRLAERIRMKKYQEELKQVVTEKAQQKAMELAWEKECLRQMDEMYDRKEESKRKYFESIANRVKRREMLASQRAKVLEEKLQEEDRRTEEVHQFYLAEQDRMEKEKEAKREQMREEARRNLEAQLAERARRQAEEEEEARREVEKAQKDLMKMKAEEAERMKRKVERSAEYRQLLDRQVTDARQRHPIQSDAMTDLEFKMNARLIETLQSKLGSAQNTPISI